MSIHIGWWAIPAAVTAVVFAKYIVPRPGPTHPANVDGVFQFANRLIVALVAWLIWSLAA